MGMCWLLAEVELTFLTVSAVALCFGFVLNTADNIEMALLLLSSAYT